LVNQLLGIFGEPLQIWASVLVHWLNVDFEAPVHLVSASDKVDRRWVIDQISQTFETIITFTNEHGFRLVDKWVVLPALAILSDHIPHLDESLSELFRSPQVNLVCLEVFHFDFRLLLALLQHFINAALLSSKVIILDRRSKL
jgi:hypothetical protein